MIGIIGQGFVGNAVYQKFSETFSDIKTFDLKPELRNTSTVEGVLRSSEYIFICLPTPMDQSGRCYTGIVENVLSDINDYCISNGTYKTCIIKSTIPPGTTKSLNEKFKRIDVMFSPEFLTEANAVEDFNNQNRIIIGEDSGRGNMVKYFVFKPVFKDAKIIIVSSMAAEMVKYTANTFLATKVMFSNEIYQLCEKLDIDHTDVVDLVRLDPRIGDSHWHVPGPDGHMGFGGHCFPKDINELIGLFIDNNIDPSIISSVWNKNLELREDKNWLEMEGRAIITEEK